MTISSTVYDLPGITEYEPAGGVCEHHPGGDVTGRLSPRVSDEPEVGHHHREPHQGVETEDHRHALPVGEEGPALRHLLVLRLLVVDHADDDQEEAGRHLDKRSVDKFSAAIPHLITAKQDRLGPGDSEAHQIELPLLSEGQTFARLDVITGVLLLHLQYWEYQGQGDSQSDR